MNARRKAKVRVVIYLRVSKDRDDQQSIENQKRECLAYAERKGWEVVLVTQDEGKSGYKPGVKRAGLDAAMNMVQTGQAEMFLVWKLSRFVRRIRQFHLFLDQLVKAGGDFDSVTDDVDYLTAQGEMMLALTAGFAQLDSAAKADFATSWNEGRTAKGAVPQGPRPFGYDRIPKDKAPRDSHGQAITLKVNRAEAEALTYAAETLLAGGSLRGILRDLGDMAGTKEAGLTSRGLRSALLNPTTAGLRALKETPDPRKPNEKVVTGYVQGCWEPILSRSTWEAVCEILTDPARSTGDGNQVKHLLSGVMVCGKCRNSFGVRRWKQANGGEGWRYTCFDCFNSAGKEVLEAAMKERLLALVDQKMWKQLKEQGRGYDPAVVKGIEQEQLALAKMWQSGELASLEVFQMMNQTLATRLSQATGAEPLDLPDVANLAKSWDTMSVVDQRRVLAVVFSEIKLDPANGTRDTLSRFFTRRAV